VLDNEQTMREYGSQAILWQTAGEPARALELSAEGILKGAELGPERSRRDRSWSGWPRWQRRTTRQSWRAE
jgi:hypothetical protein